MSPQKMTGGIRDLSVVAGLIRIMEKDVIPHMTGVLLVIQAVQEVQAGMAKSCPLCERVV